MAFLQFQKIRLNSADDLTPKNINALQDNIAAALSQLLGKDTLDSSVVKGVALKAGVINKVPHLLGRLLNGYIVTRSHGGAPLVWDVQDENPSPHLLLYLKSATDITVDLLVY